MTCSKRALGNNARSPRSLRPPATRAPRQRERPQSLREYRSSGRGGPGRAACLHVGAGGCRLAGGYRSLGGARAAAGAGPPRGAGRGRRASPPRGRVRAVVVCVAVRRAGLTPRAPGGGGEPRAARPRADAARSRSAPCPRPAPVSRRRARSLATRHSSPPRPPPRLRPVFLWARQRDGTVQEVRCEDYDPRNRIRIARTPDGWRVIPRTEIYNSIRVPAAPPRERRRRRSGRRRRVRQPAAPAPLSSPAPAAPVWFTPDLESHIPSHTIAVPRPLPVPAEPTPLDNLLAVAELEFNQQRGEEERELALELHTGAPYAYLPEEDITRNAMSFELGEPPKPPDDMYFEPKTSPPGEQTGDVDAFSSDLVAHKDLFDTISEVHYLPDLSEPHDEDLLESLVEKGCEDNQILDQGLDKFAHLVHGSEDYAEEEDDILLGGAPVTDIIDRLETSLESPGRSSMTAAQGLLHLHHIGDHMSVPEHQQSAQPTYITGEVFATEAPEECNTSALNSVPELEASEPVNDIEYQNAEKKLHSNVESSDINIFKEPVPDTNETYEEKNIEDQQTDTLPDQSEVIVPNDTDDHNIGSELGDQTQLKIEENSNTDCGENEEECAEPEAMSAEFQINITTKCEELGPTDLSVKRPDAEAVFIAGAAEASNVIEDNISEKSDEQPRDLSVHRRLPTPHASPRRMDIPRAPSRESDAMQSPQPSGIPAVPSSPEIFTMPATKSKQTLFLETLLSSPSPKMYTSEVTISKQQCEPLNLGKHRKSASPTVSSCSDEMKKLTKEFGEPQEKRQRRESTDDLVKISKIFNKSCEEQKKPERSKHNANDEISAMKQLQALKTNPDFNIPDPLLVPKDKLDDIIAAPGREIPALLLQRPELRLPEAFSYPAVLQDPNILVVSLAQLEIFIENETKKLNLETNVTKEKISTTKTSSSTEKSVTPQPDQTSQPKSVSSMDALAGDIDAATSAALNQMLWLPYLSQLEAMAACSQNMDFLKALNSSGYTGQNYPDLSQMFNHSSRFMGPTGFPMMPPMDYDNRLQFAMWQEAMNASAAQRSKPNTIDNQMKDIASKSSDVQNPYVHSTKNHQNKQHSSARTSPIAHNYNSRSMAHHPFLQTMYPGMNPNIRPNLPLPGLQIPYFNPNLMGSQRSPRTGQQKSPTSPYYPNNNYLQSVKQSESAHHRSGSSSSQESPRPRISVKSLQNLLEPAAAAASGVASRRASAHPPSGGRRRDEPEVGSTTPLGEPPPHLPPHLPPHPHDPSSFHLWHPLFGNQKSYNSPWSWTTVTATGD